MERLWIVCALTIKHFNWRKAEAAPRGSLSVVYVAGEENLYSVNWSARWPWHSHSLSSRLKQTQMVSSNIVRRSITQREAMCLWTGRLIDNLQTWIVNKRRIRKTETTIVGMLISDEVKLSRPEAGCATLSPFPHLFLLLSVSIAANLKETVVASREAGLISNSNFHRFPMLKAHPALEEKLSRVSRKRTLNVTPSHFILWRRQEHLKV